MFWFVIALFLSFKPGDTGISDFYCDNIESAKKIVDLDYPKKIPDSVQCYFVLPKFHFVVEKVTRYKGVDLLEVSNPFDKKQKRFAIYLLKGQDA